MGKTRLALQVAAGLATQFADGVAFVALAPIRDPALVLSAIAQQLGLRDAGAQPLRQTVTAALTDRQSLLVLDNFEQVTAAAPLVADLLASCPDLTMLVTSRAVLRLRGEQEYAVPPLALPAAGAGLPTPDELGQYAAVALFVQRARAVQPTFALTSRLAPVVVAICRRLDGLPLAIELAAARIKLFAPADLLRRLEHSLRLLRGGAQDLPERQRTLRGAIAWSEDLLAEAEQWLFRRLAVFVGGWRLEAAEAVCAAPEGAEPLGTDVLDGLSTLLDQSLVWQREETDGAARLRMLHVIREYALEHLEQSGEAEALWRAHVTYYLTLAEEVEPWLVGGPRLPEGLARLEREHDNLRAALAWARRQREVALGLRLAGALARFWVLRGHLSEGREWLEGLLALEAADQATRGAGRTTSTDEAVPVPGRVPGRVWAKALFGAGELATYQQDFSRAVPLLEQSLTLAREAGEMALTARLSTRAARPCFKATSGGPPRGMRRASPWRGSWAIRPSSAFQ